MNRDEWIAAHPPSAPSEEPPRNRVHSTGELQGRCGTLDGQSACGATAVYTDPYGYQFCESHGQELLQRYGGKWVFPITQAHEFQYP